MMIGQPAREGWSHLRQREVGAQLLLVDCVLGLTQAFSPEAHVPPLQAVFRETLRRECKVRLGCRSNAGEHTWAQRGGDCLLRRPPSHLARTSLCAPIIPGPKARYRNLLSWPHWPFLNLGMGGWDSHGPEQKLACSGSAKPATMR